MAGEEQSGDNLMDKASIGADIAAEIAGSDDGTSTVEEVALDTEHPKDESSEASVEETPTDTTEADGETKTETKVEGEEAVVDEAQVKADAEAKEDSDLESDLLGIKEVEPPESPVWKERHGEATRTIHEQAAEINDIKTFLKDHGRELVATKDGLALIPTGDAQDFSVDSINLDAVVNSLTADDIDLLSIEPKEGIAILASKIRAEFASSVTPITARQQDVVLTAAEQGKCWDNFVGAKTGTGKSMFPDAEDKDVQAQMSRAYEALPEDLCQLASQNSAVRMAVQEILWSRVYRVRQAKIALKQSREVKVAEQTKLNKEGLVVTGSGSEAGVKGQDTNTQAMTPAERIAKNILEVEL